MLRKYALMRYFFNVCVWWQTTFNIVTSCYTITLFFFFKYAVFGKKYILSVQNLPCFLQVYSSRRICFKRYYLYNIYYLVYTYNKHVLIYYYSWHLCCGWAFQTLYKQMSDKLITYVVNVLVIFITFLAVTNAWCYY